MHIIKATYYIENDVRGDDIIRRIARAARTCYKSDMDTAPVNSDRTLVANLINRGHEAMLEHASFSVRFIVDRGVSHELVRHRIASFAQESTRYCNYSKDRFGGEITVIEPCFLQIGTLAYEDWRRSCETAEEAYFSMLGWGCTPQEARAVLPMSLKSELVMTANIREWRHFLKLRAADATGAAHPQMKEVAVPLLNELKSLIPVVFDDIGGAK